MKTVILTYQANIPPLPLKTVNISVLTRTFPVLFILVYNTDFRYIFLYRPSTDRQLPAELPLGIMPVPSRLESGITPAPRQFQKSYGGTGTVPSQL